MIGDSLPPGLTDETFRYAVPGRPEGVCRLRTYQAPNGRPVIVVTELEENPGPSITNAAEYLWPLVWRHVGAPWPAMFLEHWPAPGDAPPDTAFGEHIDWVKFPCGDDGKPLLFHDGRAWIFGDPRWERMKLAKVLSHFGDGATKGAEE